MKEAIGYLRVSTEGQALEGVSLEAQRAKIAAWCLVNGMNLGAVYSDAGLSGKRADNRPELQKALEHASRCKGALVVYSLSRLARSTKDTILIGERLDKAGADLVSLSEKIDTTSAAGRMIFRMLAVLSEFERDCIAERTSLALQHKIAKGERAGEIPFGYSLASDGVSLEENPAEQQTISKVSSLRLQGLTYSAIARLLNREGIPTRCGGKWYPMQISNIVKRNPTVAA
jgi:DNA invertase Pin-like site-specific DNA recombinase